MSLPCLTYFSSRGRAELIRLLLADAGVEHDEIAVGLWSPTELPADFVALRASGKLAYGALPLWVGSATSSNASPPMMADTASSSAPRPRSRTSFLEVVHDNALDAALADRPPQPFPS